VTQVQPDLDPTPGRRFATPAEEARVRRTAAALEANGITVLRAANSTEAKRLVLDLIPAGSRVHQGASQSPQGVHSGVNKVLIINREWTPDRLTVVLCDEALGF
jgi:hypothetical protein